MITTMTVEDLQAYAEQFRRFEERNKVIALGFSILKEITDCKRSEDSLNFLEKRALIKALDTSIFLLNSSLLVKQI